MWAFTAPGVIWLSYFGTIVFTPLMLWLECGKVISESLEYCSSFEVFTARRDVCNMSKCAVWANRNQQTGPTIKHVLGLLSYLSDISREFANFYVSFDFCPLLTALGFWECVGGCMVVYVRSCNGRRKRMRLADYVRADWTLFTIYCRVSYLLLLLLACLFGEGRDQRLVAVYNNSCL